MSGNRKQVEDPGFRHQYLGKGGWERMNPIFNTKRKKILRSKSNQGGNDLYNGTWGLWGAGGGNQ